MPCRHRLVIQVVGLYKLLVNHQASLILGKGKEITLWILLNPSRQSERVILSVEMNKMIHVRQDDECIPQEPPQYNLES